VQSLDGIRFLNDVPERMSLTCLRRLRVEFDHEPVVSLPIRDTLQSQSSFGRVIALKDHERVYVDLHHLVSHIDGADLHNYTLLAGSWDQCRLLLSRQRCIHMIDVIRNLGLQAPMAGSYLQH
jgi:hypothetical protein